MARRSCRVNGYYGLVGGQVKALTDLGGARTFPAVSRFHPAAKTSEPARVPPLHDVLHEFGDLVVDLLEVDLRPGGVELRVPLAFLVEHDARRVGEGGPGARRRVWQRQLWLVALGMAERGIDGHHV